MVKDGNTTLIITEKPSAAEKIAAALSDGNDEKISNKDRVSYYEFDRDGKRFLVGCAVGHLYGIQQKALRGPFPNFDVEWRPNHEKNKKLKPNAYSKKYFDVLKKLAKEADEFIVATDYDVEGEVIGWNVVRFICKQKDAKRMKFSSLTKDSLEESFNSLLPSLNWGDAVAGETRHYLDWFYGINLSRALMKSLTKAGQFRILSIGRVQGPALKIIVDKEREIQKFEPEPYWQVFLQVQDIKKQRVEVKHVKDLFSESDLLKFRHLEGNKGFATTKISDTELAPPVPFNLTTLQTEAYKHLGMTPKQSLNSAQKLYLAGMISYPRTSSQKYPVGIGYDKILKRLKKYTQLVKYAVNKTPIEGKKSDPAHPAIYPTGEFKKISDGDKKLFDLIVKRFIACFSVPAITENKKISVVANDLKFAKTGLQVKEKGWMAVYPSKTKEEKIPTVDGDVDIKEIRIEEKQTKPPSRYSAASLVKELEKRNLGTKATRTSIVDTLVSRGYVEGRALEATSLGIKLVESLEKYSPVILDEALTRKFEEEMEQISVAKKDWDKKEDKIIDEAKESINGIAKDMNENMDKIGESLGDGNKEAIEKQKIENTLNPCPVCMKGNLRVSYGKKYKRYFISCDAYPECKTIFSLPPGNAKPLRDKEGELELCEECKSPYVNVLNRGRRPWRFCFNPECSSNKEWVEKKEEYKKKLKNGKK